MASITIGNNVHVVLQGVTYQGPAGVIYVYTYAVQDANGAVIYGTNVLTAITVPLSAVATPIAVSVAFDITPVPGAAIPGSASVGMNFYSGPAASQAGFIGAHAFTGALTIVQGVVTPPPAPVITNAVAVFS
jgi:hypothetical protein